MKTHCLVCNEKYRFVFPLSEDVPHIHFSLSVLSLTKQAGVRGTLGRLLGVFEVRCQAELHKVRCYFKPFTVQ